MSEIAYGHGVVTMAAYQALDASVAARAQGDFEGAEKHVEHSRRLLSRTPYSATLAWYAAAYSPVRPSIDYGKGPVMLERGWALESLKEMDAAKTAQEREVIAMRCMQMIYMLLHLPSAGAREP